MGNYNTGSGYNTLFSNKEGEFNTALGAFSLLNNETGSYNTALGASAGPPFGVSDLVNTTAIGYQAIVNESNVIRLGNDQIIKIEGQVNFSASSDNRWKENIKTIPLGLDFINKIRPVEYIRKNNKDRTKEWGVIAQELRKTLNEAGYTKGGIVQEDQSPDKYLSVRYTDLIAPMIKAIQELTEENKVLKKKNDQIQIKMDQLENQINTIQQMLNNN